MNYFNDITDKLCSLVRGKHSKSNFSPTRNNNWDILSIEGDVLRKIEKELTSTSTKITFKGTDEDKIVNNIMEITKKYNQNNLTRTKAYLDFFRRHPEVHWAFLAHMVSRNGGWNMTDIKGSLLNVIMTKERQRSFFLFLETANAAIFRDAFPQLLLYEESVRRKRSLFHLLKKFQVSSFMRPFWEEFFKSGNSKLITVALIINEQHFIEKRVIQKAKFKNEVIFSWEFQLQELFQLTHVLFPYLSKGVRLAGKKVREFESLYERIRIGKQLYSILFGIPAVFGNCKKFAFSIPHTGSREDYWPTMFSKRKVNIMKGWHDCSKNGSSILHSPTLNNAWKNVEYKQVKQQDWYQDTDVLTFFTPEPVPTSFDVTEEYCSSLHQKYIAIVGKNLLNDISKGKGILSK